MQGGLRAPHARRPGWTRQGASCRTHLHIVAVLSVVPGRRCSNDEHEVVKVGVLLQSALNAKIRQPGTNNK